MAADPVITSDVVRGSVRRHVRIQRPAAEVWARIGDPARLQEWFPGIAATEVDGTTRVITTAAGLPIPEQIVTNDPLQRRFQYRITGPLFRQHLSTLDCLDLGDGTCVVAYAADTEPPTLALVIAGAAGNALEQLRDRLEAEVTTP
jgi:Polyketide cyclase / dehydrase and lipid transport